jgi:Cellulose biosynthesis protein BcsS
VRIGVGVAAACFAAVSILCGLDGAFAQTIADGAHVDRFLLFSGVDMWRNGGFLHGGVLWSPGGLAQDGFTLKVLIGGGRYRYLSGSNEITGTQTMGAAMPGWRFKGNRFEIVATAGLDVQSHRLAPDDVGNRLRGIHAGVRAGVDIWYEPTDLLMLSGSVSGSTVGTSYWTRGAVGVRLFDRFWAGPEIGAEGDSNYRQFRIGAHATAFKTDALEWSAGIGYAHDSDRRGSVYGRIWLLTRQ